VTKQVKFGVLIAAILGTLAWLAVGGVNETSTYYKTVAELKSLENGHAKRLRVAGDVKEGSIQRSGREVRFVLKQDAETISVFYNGIDPLPDTFKDGAQAVADGKMEADGTFHAAKIQAKCASKYEADYNKLKKKPAPMPSSTSPRAAL
jgi:cytochrome c-type biogenesis protein CcmE